MSYEGKHRYHPNFTHGDTKGQRSSSAMKTQSREQTTLLGHWGTSGGKILYIMRQWAWGAGWVEVSQVSQENYGRMSSKGSKIRGAPCVYSMACGLKGGRSVLKKIVQKGRQVKFRWARAMSKAKEYYFCAQWGWGAKEVWLGIKAIRSVLKCKSSLN